MLMGALLTVGAFAARPLAREGAGWFVAADPGDEAVRALAPVAVANVLEGWQAVSGALMAIGLALALVGLVLGVRRSRG